jgi:hypothetical protein
MRYKWSPDVVDSLGINRILRIVEETDIDFEENNADNLEDLE